METAHIWSLEKRSVDFFCQMFYNLTTCVFTFKLLFFLHCWTVTHKSLLLKDHDYDVVCPVLKMTYNEGFSPNSQILKSGFPLLYPLCRLIQFSLKLTLFSLLCCRVFAVFNYSFVVYCQKTTNCYQGQYAVRKVMSSVTNLWKVCY